MQKWIMAAINSTYLQWNIFLSIEGTWCVLITNLLFASQNPTNGSQESAEASLQMDGSAVINHFIYISMTWYLDIASAEPWTGWTVSPWCMNERAHDIYGWWKREGWIIDCLRVSAGQLFDCSTKQCRGSKTGATPEPEVPTLLPVHSDNSHSFT